MTQRRTPGRLSTHGPRLRAGRPSRLCRLSVHAPGEGIGKMMSIKDRRRERIGIQIVDGRAVDVGVRTTTKQPLKAEVRT